MHNKIRHLFIIAVLLFGNAFHGSTNASNMKNIVIGAGIGAGFSSALWGAKKLFSGFSSQPEPNIHDDIYQNIYKLRNQLNECDDLGGELIENLACLVEKVEGRVEECDNLGGELIENLACLVEKVEKRVSLDQKTLQGYLPKVTEALSFMEKQKKINEKQDEKNKTQDEINKTFQTLKANHGRFLDSFHSVFKKLFPGDDKKGCNDFQNLISYVNNLSGKNGQMEQLRQQVKNLKKELKKERKKRRKLESDEGDKTQSNRELLIFNIFAYLLKKDGGNKLFLDKIESYISVHPRTISFAEKQINAKKKKKKKVKEEESLNFERVDSLELSESDRE